MKKKWNVYDTFAITCTVVTVVAVFMLPATFLSGLLVLLGYVMSMVGWNLASSLDKKRKKERQW